MLNPAKIFYKLNKNITNTKHFAIHSVNRNTMEETKNRLTVTDISIRAKSKVELYRVLTTEGEVYLPPCKECNYKLIRDIIAGKKGNQYLKK